MMEFGTKKRVQDKEKKSIGLDIGTSSVKMIELTADPNKPSKAGVNTDLVLAADGAYMLTAGVAREVQNEQRRGKGRHGRGEGEQCGRQGPLDLVRRQIKAQNHRLALQGAGKQAVVVERCFQAGQLVDRKSVV